MNKSSKKILGTCSGILIVAAMIVAGYFLLNKQVQKEAQENVLPTTEVGKILAKDLDSKYPSTATEVVKMYWRITSCLYNKADSMSNKDFDNVLKQCRKLYDQEMLDESKNSFNNMKKKLRKDIDKRKDAKESFSSYVVQSNDTLTVRKMDEKEYTTVISYILIKAKGNTGKVYENFMCRKDKDGKWKILGWEQSTADAAAAVGVE